MSDSETYHRKVIDAYEGELRGAAFFEGMVDHFAEPGSAEKLAMMGEIERRTATALRPLLDRHGLVPRDVEAAKAAGAAMATERRDLSWSELVDDMVTRYPAGLDRIAQMEAMAPEADRPFWDIFADHTRAAVDFARREKAGDPDSQASLQDFLDTHGG